MEQLSQAWECLLAVIRFMVSLGLLKSDCVFLSNVLGCECSFDAARPLTLQPSHVCGFFLVAEFSVSWVTVSEVTFSVVHAGSHREREALMYESILLV